MRYPLVHCCVLLLCCVRGYIGISISPQRNTNYRGSLPPQTNSRAQTVQTLLIDNYDSYTYNIWQLLAEVNGREPYVVYNDAYRSWEDLVAAVPPFDNIVLSPGPGDPSVAADFGLCMDAIQRSDVPLLGVCLGHQGLALAYGGNVTRASLPMHGRLSTIRHTGDSLFKDVAAYTDVVRYHSLVAQHPLPSELRATALTAVGDTIMALEHVSKPQFGIQFHPESIKTAAGKTIFQNFAAITRKYYANQESLTSSKFDSTALNTITERATEDSLPVDRLTTASRYVYVERIPLDSEATTTTEDIFARIFGSSSASFWLDSESGGPVQGRSDISPQISFMGSLDSVGSYSVEYRDFNSLAIRRYDEEKVSVENRTLFSYLRDRLTHERNAKVHIVDNDGLTIESSQIPFNVIGAYFGYIGYEVGYEATELLKRSKQWSAQYDLSFEESSTLKNISKWREESNSSQPLALLMYPSRYITYDHSSRVFYIISSTTDSCNLSQAKEGLLELSAKVISAISAESTIKDKVDNSDSQPTLLARKSKQGYKEDIDKILDNINKGETYEVCLTLQFHGSIKSVQKRERKRTSNTVAEESLETYRILRNLNPAPYASYFRYDPIKWRKSVPDAVPDSTLSWYKEGGFAICCTSPECYLKVDKVLL